MKLADLPHFVGYRLFEDGDMGARYDRANRQAEYGISRADFMNEHGDNAWKDAEDYFDRLPESEQKGLLRSMAFRMAREIDELNEGLGELTAFT